MLIATTFSLGIATQLAVNTPAFAKTKSAKVIKINKAPFKAYRAKKGYIYSNAKLTKRIHNAKNYPKTTLYSQKEAIIKKSNGKQAVYYYVMSKNRKVQGYIWHRYLTPVPIKDNIASSETSTNQPISQKALVNPINKAPDMDPTESIRSLKPIDYIANETIFDLGYNVFRFSPSSMFKSHQATVYVASGKLAPLAQAAMTKWNNVLGSQVFKLGTAKTHTLAIRLGNGTKDGWDGLYDGKGIYIDHTHFNNPNYPIAYMSENLGSQTSYQQYWTGVIAHELGHTLGLDHTGYQADLMYAPNSDGNFITKYLWKRPIERSSTGLDGTEMGTITQRDLNRARLTRVLGYW